MMLVLLLLAPVIVHASVMPYAPKIFDFSLNLINQEVEPSHTREEGVYSRMWLHVCVYKRGALGDAACGHGM
jgi:hypothetical protein